MSTRRRRSRAPLVSFVACCLTASSSAAAATHPTADSPPLPSIIAEHVRLHAPSGVELARVRVELAPHGLRLRERGVGPDLEVVQDFRGERLWFVDRDRRVAHAVPPVNESEDAGVAPAAGHAERSSFLGTDPCAGVPSRLDGRGRWRGRAVGVWRCLDENGEAVAIELVDREHRIVVRCATSDGFVDELRDIREMRFAPGHFIPSSRFRRVGERELLRGAPPIAPFDEGTDS